MHFQWEFLFSVAALSDPPMFAEPIPNVTVALGRDVSLPCVIENLGNYKVKQKKNRRIQILHKCARDGVAR